MLYEEYVFSKQGCLELLSSGLLRAARLFETDVSGLLMGPILQGQAVQEDPRIWDR